MSEMLTKAKVMEFIDSIDFSLLNDYVSRAIGIDITMVGPEKPTEIYGKFVYKLHDESNYVDKCGIMSSTFKEVRVYTSCGEVTNTGVDGEPCDDLKYWCIPAFRYYYKDGGSNGHDICYAEYCNGVWNFQEVYV